MSLMWQETAVFIGVGSVVHSEHGGLRRTVDVRIQEADARAVRRQGNREVGRNCALPYPALPGRDGHHVLDAVGFRRIRHWGARPGGRGRRAGVLVHPRSRGSAHFGPERHLGPFDSRQPEKSLTDLLPDLTADLTPYVWQRHRNADDGPADADVAATWPRDTMLSPPNSRFRIGARISRTCFWSSWDMRVEGAPPAGGPANPAVRGT